MPAKLTDMKRTAEDRRMEREAQSPMQSAAPDYPWGLCIHLDKAGLDKLGMRILPKLGDEATWTIKVKVTSVQQSASLDRDVAQDQTACDFQITEIGR